jgi:hypothetical protein
MRPAFADIHRALQATGSNKPSACTSDFTAATEKRPKASIDIQGGLLVISVRPHRLS